MPKATLDINQDQFWFCYACCLSIASMSGPLLANSNLPEESARVANLQNAAVKYNIPFSFEPLPLSAFSSSAMQTNRAGALTRTLVQSSQDLFGLDAQKALELLAANYNPTSGLTWDVAWKGFKAGMDVASLALFLISVLSPIPGDEILVGTLTLGRLKAIIDTANRGKYAIKMARDGISLDSGTEFLLNGFLLSLFKKSVSGMKFLSANNIPPEAKQRIAFTFTEIVAHLGDRVSGHDLGRDIDMTSIADKLDSLYQELVASGAKVNRKDLEIALQNMLSSPQDALLPALDQRLLAAGTLIPEDQKRATPAPFSFAGASLGGYKKPFTNEHVSVNLNNEQGRWLDAQRIKYDREGNHGDMSFYDWMLRDTSTLPPFMSEKIIRDVQKSVLYNSDVCTIADGYIPGY